MKSGFNYREIPYNYTSYSDKEIILKYFDEETWEILDELRSQRVTGRSARLLFDVIGDIFIIDRNPYIFNDFLENRKKTTALKKLHELRLKTIRSGSNSQKVNTIIDRTEKIDQEFFQSFRKEKNERKSIIKRMSRGTARKNVSFTAFDRVMHVTDATDWRVEYPRVVVYPDTVNEMVELIHAARDLGLSIIPRGGGTGLTGGAIPINRSTMVVNTEKLRAVSAVYTIISGDKEIPVIDVEAGAITEGVMKYCKIEGYIFATDPTSAWASTIGGNIAENCGGKKAVMWGTAIDNIYSYKIVMADASIKDVVRRDHPHRKILPHDTVIYDIYDCTSGKRSSEPEKTIELHGSDIRKPGVGKDITNKRLRGLPGIQKEGGDGIILSATFVLYEPFDHMKTLCLEFYGNTMTYASQAIVRILDRFKNDDCTYLTALEHWDDKYCEAISYRNKSDRSEKPKAVLLIDVESNDHSALSAASDDIINLLHEYNTEGFIAHDDKSHQAFWKDRKNLGAIARHTNAFKLNEDVVIPIESLPDFADYIDRLNIEKELENNLEVITHIEEFLAGITDENTFLASKIELFHKRLNELKERYTTALHGLDKPFSGDASQNWFSALREKKVSMAIVQNIVIPFHEAFGGYQELLESFDAIVAASSGRKIIIATHMHAGDGNIHVNIPVHSNDYRMMVEADATAGAIMEKTVELKGVISGEHGIGLTKLRYIDDAILHEYAEYKNEADPQNLFNPGKLDRSFHLFKTYTPSMNLLKKEAFILETADLKDLTASISSCVRCGKCKEVCNTQYAPGDMYYSPRNKILGVSLITEAVLYESQTSETLTFRNFKMLRAISNHCTMCHQCYKPCPVKIDFGDVTLDIRDLLAARKRATVKPVTWFTLFYLKQKGYYINKLFRYGLLKFGFGAQRLAYHIHKPFASIISRVMPYVAGILSGKMKQAGLPSMREVFNLTEKSTFYSFSKGDTVHSSVIYFPGCGSERMFSDISFSVCALLFHAGVRVVIPPEYMCCGYPFLANGKKKEADMKSFENRVLFHRMAETIGYMDIDGVLVSCGTCKEMLEKYQLDQIFPGTSVMDIHQYIGQHGLYSFPLDHDFVYHDPCHSPLKGYCAERAINEIFSVKPVKIPNCCGEGGTMALSTPGISEKLRKRKIRNIRNLRHEHSLEVLTTCPSCVQGLTKINRGISIEGKALSVYLAEKVLGKQWKKDFIREMKKNENLERIIF